MGYPTDEEFEEARRTAGLVMPRLRRRRVVKRRGARPTDRVRLDALLFNDRLDLRRRREDGKWSAGDLKTERVFGPFRDPRRAIDAFLAAVAGKAK